MLPVRPGSPHGARRQPGTSGAERERVEGPDRPASAGRQAGDWRLWGPYLSERQWGTVREDYSADGGAWGYLPHDHARSRTYRWGEDGLAGFSDVEQRLCLALTLWNGRDPILKERPFGLTGPEGNHGEDVKDYWWYLDAVPSHAWNRWRYHYPQAAFPYEDLRAENGKRGRHDPEYELLDTGAFEGDRYWIVEVHYAKATPTDLLMSIQVTNAGPDQALLHVLPTAWFRNTWSWDPDAPRPGLAATGDAAVAVHHPTLGELELLAAPGPDGTAPGSTVELRLRLRPAGSAPDAATALGSDFEQVVTTRRAEADEFYAELTPVAASPDEAMVMRQAFAGMLWSKQLYYYRVARWLDGDPGQPPPPASRRTGRNARWRSFDAFDVMSMPDKWEYPWFAAWDLAFHCVALAHVDPPVQAWAALEVFAIDGGRDLDFLSRVFDKLLVNFTWWVNREDADGSNLFEGGFLGLDNIGPLDRSHLPVGGVLEQADATGWMAAYALAMTTIAAILHRTGRRPALDLVHKFLEHFAEIRDAMERQGMWDDADGLFYDRIVTPGGGVVPVKAHSMVGIIPVLAVAVIDEELLDRAVAPGKQ